jgi:hypothetical protein
MKNFQSLLSVAMKNFKALLSVAMKALRIITKYFLALVALKSFAYC